MWANREVRFRSPNTILTYSMQKSSLSKISGKSSLMLLLLRLLDPLPSPTSSITIDNIALQTIDRETLQPRIIAMPQDPLFLPEGSAFRENLDPYDKALADDCDAVLEDIRLVDLIRDYGGPVAVMTIVSLSEGQKQLFSLARAVVRAKCRERAASMNPGKKGTQGGPQETRLVGRLLLLDEISSSVDAQTEDLIQSVIRRVFERKTTIAIAHRVDSARDFDTVVVMDGGRIKEMGAPEVVLKSSTAVVSE